MMQPRLRDAKRLRLVIEKASVAYMELSEIQGFITPNPVFLHFGYFLRPILGKKYEHF
jgi:hypothetical protein